MTGLDREFLGRPSFDVAPQLLNKILEHDGVSGRIVEVEAYDGAGDPASHAHRGRTRRNAAMFGPPGLLYVYFTYGMHFCANVVCGDEGQASAVLIRALAPLDGLEVMRRRRGLEAPNSLCSGPAKLCQALAIARVHDGLDLLSGSGPRLVDDGVDPPVTPEVGTRVGIRRATDRRWRWWVKNDRNVSRGPVMTPV